MNLCLHPPVRTTSAFACSSSTTTTTNNNKTPNHSQIHKPKKPPILKTHSQSNLQSVITNLQSSINSGITISDPHLFASLLETCFRFNAAHYAAKIHRLIPPNLLRNNLGISSKLLRLYARCGDLENAHHVFDQMSDRKSSAFVWNSLISGYAEAGLYEDALALYFQMAEEGVQPDRYTFPRALKACGGVGMVRVGEEVHRHVVRSGCGSNTFVLNALVDMYAKCGDIVRARKVFDAIGVKELVSWNTMIVGYAKHGLVKESFFVLRWMVREGCEPDSVTLSGILTSMPHYRAGGQIHGWVLRKGIDWNLSIGNCLIVYYSNRDDLVKTRWLFERMPNRDVVTWNSIISAHSKDPLAIEYFNRMMESSDASPDVVTFVSLLSMCARLGMVEDGEKIFLMMMERFGIRPSMEHYACMVNLYARAGLIDEAYEFIVERMEMEAGATVWGALLYGCYLHGNAEIGEIAANRLFELEPDGEHNFELLIKIYHKVGRVKDVERIRNMMAERGLEL